MLEFFFGRDSHDFFIIKKASRQTTHYLVLLICFSASVTADSDDEDSDSQSEMATDPPQVWASLQRLSFCTILDVHVVENQ